MVTFHSQSWLVDFFEVYNFIFVTTAVKIKNYVWCIEHLQDFELGS